MDGIKLRRVFINNFSLKLGMGLFVVFQLAFAYSKTLEVKEIYSNDNGTYRKGQIGEALWVYSKGGLKYPLVLSEKNLEEGSISFWFKPTRQSWYQRTQDLLKLSDGKQSIIISLFGGKPKTEIPPRYLRVTVSGKEGFKGSRKHLNILAPKNLHESFHNIIYTWNSKEAVTYLDGKVVGQVENKGKWFAPFDRSKFDVTVNGYRGVWFDEIIIQDKYLNSSEVESLYKRTSIWEPNANTRLHLPFDGDLNGETVIGNDAAGARLTFRIGRPQASFSKDDPTRILFKVFNTSSKDEKYVIHGEVYNIHRKKILDESLGIEVPKGDAATLDFKMDIKEKGLFWGDFSLKNSNGEILAKERIPFASTLAVDVKDYAPEDIPTGFVTSRGINPPASEKWAGFEFNSMWRDLEYAPGKWDFETLDMLVEDAKRTGRQIHLVLFGSPDWQAKRFSKDKYPNWNKRNNACPEDLEAYKEYVRKLGERYKGVIYDYEVWNEPYWNDPAGGYFYGSKEQYANLVKISAEVLRKIDPKIKVCAGLGGNELWQKTVAEKTAGYADYYGIHPYHLAKVSDGNEDSIIKKRELLKKEGANFAMANTEISDLHLGPKALHEDGYPMTAEEFDKSGRWEKMPEFYKSRGRKYFHVHYTSADFLVRSLILGLAGGCDKYFLWWGIGPGSSCLTFKINTPSLQSVAYENVSGLLAGAKFAKKIDLGADYLKAYLFEKKNGADKLLVAWADQKAHSAFLELGEETPELIDLYGNPYPYEKIGPVVKIELTASPVYIKGFKELPTGGKPVFAAKVKGGVAFPNASCEIEVSMYNPLAEDLKGSLSVALPKSFPAISDKMLTLKSKEAMDFNFEFKVPADAVGDRDFRVSFKSPTKGFEDIVLDKTLMIKKSAIVKKLDRKLTFDGDLKDWGELDSFPISINSPFQVKLGKTHLDVAHDAKLACDWSGEKDLSAKAALAYDKENLYIAIRVYDDDLVNLRRETPANSYNGDCIEIFLDARAAEKQGSPSYDKDVFQIYFIPSMKDFPAPMVYVAQPRRFNFVGMVMDSKFYPDGYSLELKIPRSNFPKLKLEEECSVGFDISIDDQDGMKVKKRSTQMIWAGSKENFADPSKFGKIFSDN